ncbi:MAG: MFS transporter [Pseudomonadota bacterium]
MLYSSQGLPFGLFIVALPAWFASQGLDAAEIGQFIAIVFLPWSFKLIAGPIMDKFTFAPMGRRRPWVLGAQLGIIISFLLVSVLSPDPKEGFMVLAALGFMCNFFGALQDVAVDGMAIDILEEDERAQANAYMYGGQIAGISLATSLGGHALASYGLSVAAIIMLVLVFLTMLVPLFLREREGERVLPWSDGEAAAEVTASSGRSWKEIVGSLLKVLFLPLSILLVMAEGLSRITAGLVTTINPVITVQELGWQQTAYSDWYAICGVIAAVVGVIVGRRSLLAELTRYAMPSSVQVRIFAQPLYF